MISAKSTGLYSYVEQYLLIRHYKGGFIMKIFSEMFIIILCLNLTLHAEVIHVPDDYETIQQAIDEATDGDSILVSPGLYNISSNIYNDHVNNLHLIGTVEEDGTYKSVINAAVDPGIYNVILFTDVSGCTIQGFEVKNGHAGITLLRCKQCVVTKNYVHDNDQLTSFHGNGISAFECSDVEISYNITDHNEYHGIDIGYGNTNILIKNNTVLRTYAYDGIELGYPYIYDLTIINNIIAYSCEEGIDIQASLENFYHDFNCFYNNGYGPIEGMGMGLNSIDADPKLVDIERGVYFLRTDSPCINRGLDNAHIGALGVLEGPVNHVLQNFALLEPPEDATLNSTKVTLKWQSAIHEKVYYPEEIRYLIYYDTNMYFNSPLLLQTERDTTITLYGLNPGSTYFWKVCAQNIANDTLWCQNEYGFFIDLNATDIEQINNETIPIAYLHPNYPNPFNASTTIRYAIGQDESVSITIYNSIGQKVRMLVEEFQQEGTHRVLWDGTNDFRQNVSSGIYIIHLRTGSVTKTNKMMLLR